MKNKLVIKIIIAYFILLSIILLTQLPKKENSAQESIEVEVIYKDKLSDALVAYVESPVALVNKKQVLIDKNDSYACAKLFDGQAYIPARFFAQSFNANLSWDKSRRETILRLNNRAVIFKENEKEVRIVDNESERVINTSKGLVIYNRKSYLPVRILAEAFEKNVFYNNGLIIISGKSNEFDYNEAAGIEDNVNSLPFIGNAQFFMELIGKDSNLLGVDLFSKDNFFDENRGQIGLNKNISELNNGNGFDLYNDNENDSNYIINNDEYTYILKDNTIYTLSIKDEEQKIVSKSVINSGFMDGSLYFSNDRLIVSGNRRVNLTEQNSLNNDDKNVSLDNNTNNNIKDADEKSDDLDEKVYTIFCEAYIYKIGEEGSLSLERSLSLDGNFVQTKIVNNSLYLISKVNSEELNFGGTYAAPSYLDTLADKERKRLNFDEINYFPEMVSDYFINIAKINLSNLSDNSIIYSLFGGTDNIVFSDNNLFIANDCYIKNEKGKSDTSIYKFELNDNGVLYSGRKKIEGCILNNNFINAENGKIKIVTTLFDYEDKGLLNCIYILDNNLNVVENVSSIAKEKYIKDVKFLKDRVYFNLFNEKPLAYAEFKDKIVVSQFINIGEINNMYLCNEDLAYVIMDNTVLSIKINSDSIQYFTKENNEEYSYVIKEGYKTFVDNNYLFVLTKADDNLELENNFDSENETVYNPDYFSLIMFSINENGEVNQNENITLKSDLIDFINVIEDKLYVFGNYILNVLDFNSDKEIIEISINQ